MVNIMTQEENKEQKMRQKITKKSILALATTTALVLVGCGGGSGGSSENKNTKNSPETHKNTTGKKVIMLEGKWQKTDSVKFLKRSDMDHIHADNIIYKKYDGEYGKGVLKTSCTYYPKTANWGKIISYNGISCPYSTNNHGLSRSAHSEGKKNEDDFLNRAEGDWALVGQLEIDGVMFFDHFYGEASLPRVIIDPSLAGKIETYNKIVKINPSSDNRSLNCSNGANSDFLVSKPTSDIKFYRYLAIISNGVKSEEKWYKNCIISSPMDWYSKNLKDVYISDRDFTVSAQIGKDNDDNVYTTSSHWKKID